MAIVKNEKIRCFYADVVRVKPNRAIARNFIHTRQSFGFWAHIRDLSQRERSANDAVGHQTVVQIIVGYNPRIIELWEKLVIIDERGTTYKIKEKPDEYEYTKGDIKIIAYAFRDDTVYGEDVYE